MIFYQTTSTTTSPQLFTYNNMTSVCIITERYNKVINQLKQLNRTTRCAAECATRKMYDVVLEQKGCSEMSQQIADQLDDNINQLDRLSIAKLRVITERCNKVIEELKRRIITKRYKKVINQLKQLNRTTAKRPCPSHLRRSMTTGRCYDPAKKRKHTDDEGDEHVLVPLVCLL